MSYPVVILLGAVALGVAVPWVAMRMLIGSLRDSPAAASTNYAGRRVAYGLGVVWAVWAGCAIVFGVGVARFDASSPLVILTIAGAVSLVAFALGLFDDAYGTSAAKGFKGHIKAMLSGRLTTGGLKLVGIGMSCLVAAAVVARTAPWATGLERFSAAWFALVALAGAAIALTSNLLNLFDLRPGRALKVYSLFAAAGVLSYATGVVVVAVNDTIAAVVTVLALALFVLGPVIAVWGYDVTEQGMLGDAGANPMGVVAGTLIVAGLGVWGLAAYLVGVMALNLASERISFSRVIANNALLSKIDGLGRLPEDTGAKETAKSGPHVEGNHE